MLILLITFYSHYTVLFVLRPKNIYVNMVYCAVVGWTNHSDKGKDLGISFHTFPKHNLVHKQWVNFYKSKDEFNSGTTRICFNIFLHGDFEKDLNGSK